MKIKQSRFTNKTEFDFGDETVEYRVRDSSGSRSFTVDYLAKEERDQKIAEVVALFRSDASEAGQDTSAN